MRIRKLSEIFGLRSATKTQYRNPIPTVDIIIEYRGGIVLIERNNAPLGWAIPGGFVDYGESLEHAACREAKEETNLDVQLKSLLYCYSSPERDPRQHTVSTVFIAKGQGELLAQDDAKSVRVFRLKGKLPPLVFDHALILQDYLKFRKTKKLPQPRS